MRRFGKKNSPKFENDIGRISEEQLMATKTIFIIHVKYINQAMTHAKDVKAT